MEMLPLIVILFSRIAATAITDIIPKFQIHQNDNTKFDLIILHNNDMHSRFEQIDKLTGSCRPEDAQANECYGGFARVSSIVKHYRQMADNGGTPVLYLNAGDSYSGTPWFSLFQHKVVSDFMNILRPDAMCLGNHEFDIGVENLLPFLNEVTFPVVTANLNVSADHPLWKTRSLKRSVVFEIKGHKVGVIGALTPDTKDLITKEDIAFEPEIESINIEAKSLARNGVNIIIALCHSGYKVEQEIAEKCPLVDLVVGGHSHSFLYSGNIQQVENVEGPYPTVITQLNGKEVPVVQAFGFTKYMGKLKLTFDSDGNLIEYSGHPILLDHSIGRDPEVVAMEEIYRPRVQDIVEQVIGITKVQLDGQCRRNECNVGNMITTAFIHARMNQNQNVNITDPAIAFVAGGDIRASIKMGEIRRYDLETVLPYDNDLVLVNISGNVLREVLEHSVHRYTDGVGHGEFLQMSGIRVVYDMTKAAGERISSISVLCSDCKIPSYEQLDENHEYGVIITSFVFDGGDGFSMFQSLKSHRMNITVTEAVQNYIQNRHIIYPSVDDRITIHT